jgi:riboflavin biosynthesis pyrimidine reductase
MEGDPNVIVDMLSKRGLDRLYVDGGKTIQEFLSYGLIDELILSRLPVLIGAGVPLFGKLPADIRLKHLKTSVFPGGMVQTEYMVSRE